jgi:hypothetical protein
MPFTTINNVRIRSGFYATQHNPATDGIRTQIKLEHRADSIMLLVKNGDRATPLTPTTHFTFAPPKLVNLVGSGQGASGDFYDTMYGTKIDDLALDAFLRDATSTIQTTLRGQLGTEMATWEDIDAADTSLLDPAGRPKAPIRIQELTAKWTTCLALEQLQTRNNAVKPEEMAALNTKWNWVRKELKMIFMDPQNLSDDITLSPLVDGRGEGFVFDDLPQVNNISFKEEEERLDIRGREKTRFIFGGWPNR